MISDDLTTLELVDCGITDHQFASIDFTVMRRFTDLNVSGNPDLTDISSVSVCAGNLTRLEISDTGIRSFDWLKQLTKLEVFRADRTGLADISVLEAMIYLEELSLSGNGINSLKGLKNTSKLSVVDLSDNYLTDVLVLGRSVANLSVLHLENNCLSDLNCLSGASQLRKVYVDGNTLADLDWLKASRDLRILSASHNCIESISGLGIGNKMRYLNLADNWLTNIARGDLAFEEASYLMVDLSNNRLTELELPENCTYRHLAILGNPELDLRNLSKLKGWNLYFDFPVDVSLQTLKNLPFNNLCMVGCPLDRQVEIEEGLYTEELMTLEDALAEIAEQAKEADY
jgi:Leucine-rich repeat (LRR) protein